MDLLEKLQTALIDINKDEIYSTKTDQHAFLRKRAKKVTDRLISDLDWQEIMSSVEDIPHQLSHLPDSNGEDRFVPFFFSYIENEFTKLLESVLTLNGQAKQLFMNDLDFVGETFKSLSTGWIDACEKCGQELHIKLDPFHNRLYQVNYPKDESPLECDYKPSKLEHVVIATPSRKLIVSDSLNDFILLHNKQISSEYKNFVKDHLMTTSSTSLRGKDLLRAFYARFNMGYFNLGKGHLNLVQTEENTSFVRLNDYEKADSKSVGNEFFELSSRYLTLMDLDYFKTVCQSKSLNHNQAMRSINAQIVELDSEFIEINNYRTDDDEVHLVISEFSQNISSDSEEASLEKK